MKKLILTFSLCCLFSAAALAQTAPSSTGGILPDGSQSDGCTLFPDGCHRDCCEAHDQDYFKGGTWRERWKSDARLFRCVARKNGWHHKIIAPLMWAGVRVGGAPFLPTPFRWGFGKKRLKKTTPKIQTKQRTTEK